MEETESPTRIRQAIQQGFLSKKQIAEWENSLKQEKVFDSDDTETWIVTEENLERLLAPLDLGDYLFQVEQQALDSVDQYKNALPFKVLSEVLQESNSPIERSGQIRPTLVQKDFTSPASLICQLLKEFANVDAGDEREKRLRQAKIDYVFGKINVKAELYKVDSNLRDIITKAHSMFDDDDKNNKQPVSKAGDMDVERKSTRDNKSSLLGLDSSLYKKRHSIQIGTGWLKEYSYVNMQNIQKKYLERDISVSGQSNKGDADTLSQDSSLGKNKNMTWFDPARQQLQLLQTQMKTHESLFEKADSPEFHMFDYYEKIGRNHALPCMAMHILEQLPDMPLTELNINMEKLAVFLNKIQKGYRQDNGYHNDIHGTDVMQMSYFIMTKGGLNKLAGIDVLDQLSLVISALCHDFDHDGLNNSYHVNAMSTRAIRYHDQAVQENYHTAESLSILLSPNCNFLENQSQDEIKRFRKRMVGLILATDMATHLQDLETVKRKIEQLEISKEKKNGDLFIDKSTSQMIFQSQQQLMEICMHAADVSTPARSFDQTHRWTYMLFDEFFKQGDLEKKEELPISFLCDRTTTNVVKSQPGFLSFIVLPLFNTIENILPDLKDLPENARKNLKEWENYTETEADKQVYELFKGAPSIKEQKSEDSHESSDQSKEDEEKKAEEQK